jgi:MFS family permease
MQLETLEEFFLIKHVKNWYLRFERPISSLSLVGGFIFDIFVLERIDEPLENIWVGVHLFVAAAGILLLNLLEKKKAQKDLQKMMSEKAMSILHFWLIIIVQFGFGGLLSTFLVFYFRSATLGTSWPFLLLLAVAFGLNEILKQHYVRFSFQVSMLFLSAYSFAIYIVPVVLHRIGDDVFLISGVASLAFIAAFLAVLRLLGREHFWKNRYVIAAPIVVIFLIVNILYFTNIIPPIPLSLKDGGIYHSIMKASDGSYALEYEKGTWLDYFKPYEDYHTVPGEPVYAYSAVFSPTNLNTDIIHVWQYYDENLRKWVTASRITLPIIGGRGGGYRTYSEKANVTPGLWRVDVENSLGQIIGRLRFNVVTTFIEPQLSGKSS